MGTYKSVANITYGLINVFFCISCEVYCIGQLSLCTAIWSQRHDFCIKFIASWFCQFHQSWNICERQTAMSMS